MAVVDRPTRQLLSALIEKLVDGSMTCLDFEAALDDLPLDDPLVAWTVESFWGVGDDGDTVFACDRPAWKALQRVRLLLSSDAATATNRRPAAGARTAAVVLAVFVLAAIAWGPSLPLFGLAWLLLAIDSMERTSKRSRHPPHPFTSRGQIRRLLRSTDFRTAPYPDSMRHCWRQRRTTERRWDTLRRLTMVALAPVVVPFILIARAAERDTNLHLVP